MPDKLEEKLDNPLFGAIAKGITIVTTVTCGFLTLIILFATIFINPWWFLALIPCSVLSGAGLGFGFYLFDEF